MNSTPRATTHSPRTKSPTISPFLSLWMIVVMVLLAASQVDASHHGNTPGILSSPFSTTKVASSLRQSKQTTTRQIEPQQIAQQQPFFEKSSHQQQLELELKRQLQTNLATSTTTSTVFSTVEIPLFELQLTQAIPLACNLPYAQNIAAMAQSLLAEAMILPAKGNDDETTTTPPPPSSSLVVQDNTCREIVLEPPPLTTTTISSSPGSILMQTTSYFTPRVVNVTFAEPPATCDGEDTIVLSAGAVLVVETLITTTTTTNDTINSNVDTGTGQGEDGQGEGNAITTDNELILEWLDLSNLLSCLERVLTSVEFLAEVQTRYVWVTGVSYTLLPMPTAPPSVAPSLAPSQSFQPTTSPSFSLRPSTNPSSAPPTLAPTTTAPTAVPTTAPSAAPTATPTASPTTTTIPPTGIVPSPTTETKTTTSPTPSTMPSSTPGEKENEQTTSSSGKEVSQLDDNNSTTSSSSSASWIPWLGIATGILFLALLTTMILLFVTKRRRREQGNDRNKNKNNRDSLQNDKRFWLALDDEYDDDDEDLEYRSNANTSSSTTTKRKIARPSVVAHDLESPTIYSFSSSCSPSATTPSPKSIATSTPGSKSSSSSNPNTSRNSTSTTNSSRSRQQQQQQISAITDSYFDSSDVDDGDVGFNVTEDDDGGDHGSPSGVNSTGSSSSSSRSSPLGILPHERLKSYSSEKKRNRHAWQPPIEEKTVPFYHTRDTTVDVGSGDDGDDDKCHCEDDEEDVFVVTSSSPTQKSQNPFSINVRPVCEIPIHYDDDEDDDDANREPTIPVVLARQPSTPPPPPQEQQSIVPSQDEQQEEHTNFLSHFLQNWQSNSPDQPKNPSASRSTSPRHFPSFAPQAKIVEEEDESDNENEDQQNENRMISYKNNNDNHDCTFNGTNIMDQPTVAGAESLVNAAGVFQGQGDDEVSSSSQPLRQHQQQYPKNFRNNNEAPTSTGPLQETNSGSEHEYSLSTPSNSTGTNISIPGENERYNGTRMQGLTNVGRSSTLPNTSTRNSRYPSSTSPEQQARRNGALSLYGAMRKMSGWTASRQEPSRNNAQQKPSKNGPNILNDTASEF